MHYDRNSHPRFIGDRMSNLTGSVAPDDHATYGHVKGHQKVYNVHIKVNYDPVTNPFLSARLAASAARNRRRCSTLRCRGGSRQCSGGILVSQRLAPQRAKYLVGSIVCVIQREYPPVIIYYTTHIS